MATEATQEEFQAGRGYESLFVPALFAPWTPHLIDGTDIQAGSHVLDLACGSGVLARAALKRSGETGRVVGLDVAPGMIAAAQEAEPDIEWVLGRAEDLPFEDGAFDCVVSQFGMMFFQDRLKAVQEMQRVTKPGGRLAVAVWHSLDRNPAYADVAAVIEEHVSPEAADAVRIPFCLGDHAEVTELLSEAGFENVTFATESEQATFPSSKTMVEVELRGWLPLFDIHLPDDKIAVILEKSDERLSKYTTSSGEAVFPTRAHVFTATKPI